MNNISQISSNSASHLSANLPHHSEEARIGDLRAGNLELEVKVRVTQPPKKRWRVESGGSAPKRAKLRYKSPSELIAIMNDPAVPPSDRAKAKGSLAIIIEGTSRNQAIEYSTEVMNDPKASQSIREIARKNLSIFINRRAREVFDEAIAIRDTDPGLATRYMIQVMTGPGISGQIRSEAKMELAAWNPKREIAIELYTEVMNDPEAAPRTQVSAKCYKAILIATEDRQGALELLTEVGIDREAWTSTKLLADYHFAKLIESTDPRSAMILFEAITKNSEAEINLLVKAKIKFAILIKGTDPKKAIQHLTEAMKAKGITPDLRAAAKSNLAILITEDEPRRAKELFTQSLEEPGIKPDLQAFIQSRLVELNQKLKSTR